MDTLNTANGVWPDASSSILSQIEEAEREFLAAAATGSGGTTGPGACEILSPCVNGGTCFDQSNGLYRCACPPGFLGRTCAYAANFNNGLFKKEHTEEDTNVNPKSNTNSNTNQIAQSPSSKQAAAQPVSSNTNTNANTESSQKSAEGKQERRQRRKEKSETPASVPTSSSSHSSPASPNPTPTTNTVTDYCAKFSPCLHGGKCQSLSSSTYKCICPKGWVGHDCALAMDNSKWSDKKQKP